MAKKVLGRMARLVQGQLPLHATSAVIPRGITIPIDVFLSGKGRFIKRIGSSFSVMIPDNEMRTTKEVVQGSTTITTDGIVSGVDVGAIVSFSGKERQFVLDVDTDENQITLDADGGTLSAYGTRTPVYLHAVPITVEGNTAVGATSVIVTAQHVIVLGDEIEEIVEEGNPNSIAVHNVTGLVITTEDTDPPYQYTITLDTGLIGAISDKASLYLKANPGYKSRPLPLPTQASVFGTNPIGPFLWDIQEGRLHDGIDDPEVTFAIRTLSSAYQELDAYAVTEKNTPHYRCPMDQTAFLFWNVHRGQITVKDKRPTLIPNDLGDCLIFKEVVPNLPASIGWYGSAIASDVCTLKVNFHIANPSDSPSSDTVHTWEPNIRVMSQVFNLSVGGNTLLIKSPAFECNRIEVALFTDTPKTTEVNLRGWSQTAGRSSWVEYSVVAKVNGGYTWGCSGLMVKPLFFNSDSLRSKVAPRLDTGEVLF